MKPVRCDSRNVGDKIQVYNTLSGYNTRLYMGEIVYITKKYVTVRHPLGSDYRFHRATGFIVGYCFPQIMDAIAPETSK